MRPFPLLVPKDQIRIGMLAFLAGLFPRAAGRGDIRSLPDHLKRDIGLQERPAPDWDRLLR